MSLYIKALQLYQFQNIKDNIHMEQRIKKIRYQPIQQLNSNQMKNNLKGFVICAAIMILLMLAYLSNYMNQSQDHLFKQDSLLEQTLMILFQRPLLKTLQNKKIVYSSNYYFSERIKSEPQNKLFKKAEEYYYEKKYQINTYEELPICLLTEPIDTNQKEQAFTEFIQSLSHQNYDNYRLIVQGNNFNAKELKKIYHDKTSLKEEKSLFVALYDQKQDPILRYCQKNSIVVSLNFTNKFIGHQALKVINAIYHIEKVDIVNIWNNFLDERTLESQRKNIQQLFTLKKQQYQHIIGKWMGKDDNILSKIRQSDLIKRIDSRKIFNLDKQVLFDENLIKQTKQQEKYQQNIGSNSKQLEKIIKKMKTQPGAIKNIKIQSQMIKKLLPELFFSYNLYRNPNNLVYKLVQKTILHQKKLLAKGVTKENFCIFLSGIFQSNDKTSESHYQFIKALRSIDIQEYTNYRVILSMTNVVDSFQEDKIKNYILSFYPQIYNKVTFVFSEKNSPKQDLAIQKEYCKKDQFIMIFPIQGELIGNHALELFNQQLSTNNKIEYVYGNHFNVNRHFNFLNRINLDDIESYEYFVNDTSLHYDNYQLPQIFAFSYKILSQISENEIKLINQQNKQIADFFLFKIIQSKAAKLSNVSEFVLAINMVPKKYAKSQIINMLEKIK